MTDHSVIEAGARSVLKRALRVIGARFDVNADTQALLDLCRNYKAPVEAMAENTKRWPGADKYEVERRVQQSPQNKKKKERPSCPGCLKEKLLKTTLFTLRFPGAGKVLSDAFQSRKAVYAGVERP